MPFKHTPSTVPSVRSITSVCCSVAILAAWTVSGCCEKPKHRGPAPTTSQPSSSISSCKKNPSNIGSWRPSRDQLLRTALALPNDTCVPRRQLATALGVCSRTAESTVIDVSLKVPKLSACQHKVTAVSWNGRHWIHLGVFVGEGASFHGQTYVYEVEHAKLTPYYTGFMGGSDLCASAVPNANNVTSAAMRRDWPKLSDNIRKLMCE